MKINKQIKNELSFLTKNLVFAITRNDDIFENINVQFKNKYIDIELSKNSTLLLDDFLFDKLYIESNDLENFILEYGNVEEFSIQSPFVFSSLIVHRNHIYSLNHELLYKEIYSVLNELINTSKVINTSYLKLIDQIENYFSGIQTAIEKINFLELLLKKLHDIGELSSDFLLYQNKPNNSTFESWQEFIFFDIDEPFLKHYLTSKFSEEADESFFIENNLTDWVHFYLRKKIVLFVEDKIKKFNNENNSFSLLNHIPSEEEISLFKGNGIDIFNTIISNYKNEKNPAFFSYLFFFLKANKLLNISGTTDSVKYRDYILKKYGVSFPRIINSSAQKQTEHENKMNEFKNIIDVHLKKN